MKVIVTGASGMVGEGVLLECLRDARVTEVLALGRKPCGRVHPKLREVLHPDFMNLEPVEKNLHGYDACFFCLGVSSVGMPKDTYERLTRDLTLELARRLQPLNPALTFCYVTGMNTDANSRTHWARVKGATENALLGMFPNAYMFRPGGMYAVPGQKNLKPLYAVFEKAFFPLFQLLKPSWICSLSEVGQAMINCAERHPAKRVLEVADIKAMA